MHEIMKNILLLFGILLFAFDLSAQNYEQYLQQAYEFVNNGDIVKARQCYEIYKKMTEKSNPALEIRLKKMTDKTQWMEKCHIIAIDDTTSIAMQFVETGQSQLSYPDAETAAADSRTFGFTDWTLPTQKLMKAITESLSSKYLPYEEYWCKKEKCDASSTIIIVKKTTHISTGRTSTKKIPTTTLTSHISYYIMTPMGHTIETYSEDKKVVNGKTTEYATKGDAGYRSNYVIIRLFNPQKPNDKLDREDLDAAVATSYMMKKL